MAVLDASLDIGTIIGYVLAVIAIGVGWWWNHSAGEIAGKRHAELVAERDKAERKAEELHGELVAARQEIAFLSRRLHPVVQGVPRPAESFRGRREKIDLAVRALQLQGTVVLCGPPGAGKTELAIAVQHRVHDEFGAFPGGVLWAKVGGSPAIPKLLSGWCQAVRVPAGDQSALTDELNARVMLLVLDDVWHEADARRLMIGNKRCGHILTTHEDEVVKMARGLPGTLEIRLTELEPDDGYKALRAWAGLEERESPGPPNGADLEPVLRDLCRRAGYMPFTLAVMGVYLRRRLAELGRAAISASQLEEITQPLRDARRVLKLERPQLLTSEHVEYRESEISPYAVLSVVDKRLTNEERETMQTVGVLLPKPASFTAADVGALFVPKPDESEVARRLAAVASHFLVETDDSHREAGATGNGSSHGTGTRYSFHELVGLFFADQLHDDAAKLVALRQRVVALVEREIEPSDDETFPDDPSERNGVVSHETPWERAHRFESDAWHWAASQLLHQLGQVDDRLRARFSFDRLYFDRLWWWGGYLREERSQELIDDWARVVREDGDGEHLKAVKKFHEAYKPVQQVWQRGEMPTVPDYDMDWRGVQKFLNEIRELDGLDGALDEDAKLDHRVGHARAVTAIFMAQSHRHLDAADHEADRLYMEAADLFKKCPADCHWNLAWVKWELADTELARHHEAQARVHADEGLRLAVREAGDTPDKVIANRKKVAYELVANCLRARGDASWQTGVRGDASQRSHHWSAALEAYASACVFAYAFQYWPHAPDEYTIAFYGEIVARTLDRVATWVGESREEAHQAVDELVKLGRRCYPIDEPQTARSSVAAFSRRDLLSDAFAPRPSPGWVTSSGGESDAKIPEKFEQAVIRQLEQLNAEVFHAHPSG